MGHVWVSLCITSENAVSFLQIEEFMTCKLMSILNVLLIQHKRYFNLCHLFESLQAHSINFRRSVGGSDFFQNSVYFFLNIVDIYIYCSLFILYQLISHSHSVTPCRIKSYVNLHFLTDFALIYIPRTS